MLAIIAILAILGFCQVNIQKKQYINIFGYSVLSAETGSMSPTIEKGDIVIGGDIKVEEEIKKSVCALGNVYAEVWYTVNVSVPLNYEKVTYNNTDDLPIQKEQVIGKVVFIVNNVEIWKKVFTDAHVIIPVIITVILFVALISYKEKKGEEND